MRLFTGLGGVFTGLTGAVIEAWAQLRIGKLRVLLSLVGVAVAVAAMSFVIAVGQVSVSAVNAVMEQYSGRPGTVTISVSPTWRGVSRPDDGAPRERRTVREKLWAPSSSERTCPLLPPPVSTGASSPSPFPPSGRWWPSHSSSSSTRRWWATSAPPASPACPWPPAS